MKETESITVVLPKALKNELQMIAMRQNTDMSKIIRYCISAMMEKLRGSNQMDNLIDCEIELDGIINCISQIREKLAWINDERKRNGQDAIQI